MIKINYGGTTYFLDESLSEVLNAKLEKLSKVDYEKLSFTKSEFLNFLIEYHKKKSKIIFHTELSIRELISQNLSKEGLQLSLKMTQGLLKGHNYSIIKAKDTLSTLVLLDKIKEKNALTYVQCSFPLGPLKTDKLKKKVILKYISAPYGSHDKENFSTAPILLPIVLAR